MSWWLPLSLRNVINVNVQRCEKAPWLPAKSRLWKPARARCTYICAGCRLLLCVSFLFQSSNLGSGLQQYIKAVTVAFMSQTPLSTSQPARLRSLSAQSSADCPAWPAGPAWPTGPWGKRLGCHVGGSPCAFFESLWLSSFLNGRWPQRHSALKFVPRETCIHSKSAWMTRQLPGPVTAD